MEILFGLIGLLAALAVPVCAVAGFAIALRSRRRLIELEARLVAAEGALAELRLGPPTAGLVAAPPTPAPEQDRSAPPQPRADAPAPDAPPPVEEPAAAQPPPETPPAEEPPAEAPPVEEPPAERPPAPEPAALPAAARLGLEERLGTRWAVWVGGVALALGGVLLVRYSIAEGLIGPAARILLGALFSLALLVVGEHLRRRGGPATAAAFGAAYAPGVLTAAGAMSAFATAYAAHALYGFLPGAATVVLLGAIALGVMVAAALHGPGLAGLGLVGALVAPILVQSDDPNLWSLPPYLFIVAGCAYGVARLRRWLWLALATAIGAAPWTAILAGAVAGVHAPALVHLVLQTALAVVAFVVLPHGRRAPDEGRFDPVATGVLAGFAVLAALLLAILPLGPAALIATGGLCAALLCAAALRYAPAAAGALLAALVAAAALAGWPTLGAGRTPATLLPGGGPLPWPAALGPFLGFAAIAGLALAAGPAVRLLRAGPELARGPAALLVAAAAGGPLLLLASAYGRFTDTFRFVEAAPAVPFAAVAGLVALGYAALAGRLRASEPPGPESPRRLLLAWSAAASLAALAAGLVFLLDRGMLTVALALAALGAAFVSDRTGIPTLRLAVGALATVVLLRLLDDPTLVDDPGRTPLFNWILVGYGVPAVAFLLASRILDRVRRDGISRLSESLGLGCAAFLVVFQIRHALNAGDPLAPIGDHLEVGLLTASALVFALVALRVEALRPDPVTRWAAVAATGAALLGGFVLLGESNPLLTDEPVAGGVLFNTLLPGYLAPAVLAAGLAVAARAAWPPALAPAAAGLAIVLQAVWTLLAVRHAFQGAFVGIDRPTSEGEMWAYSAALIAVGALAIAFGMLRRLRVARLVGASYVALAAVKVFLVDLAELEGVLRALSFIGLGLTLVAIGLAYQRLFARSAAPRRRRGEPGQREGASNMRLKTLAV